MSTISPIEKTIPAVDEIYLKAEQYDLKIVEANLHQGDESTKVLINNTRKNSLDKFIEIVQVLDKGYFFLEVEYWTQEDLESKIIDTDSITKDRFGDVYNKIKRKANKYNSEVLSQPIDKPVTIELFICDDGIVYSLEFIQEWYENLGGAEDALVNICAEFENDIISYYEQEEEYDKQQQQELQQNEIKERQRKRQTVTNELANDAIFRNCTTKAARLEYTIQFLIQNDLAAASKADAEGIAELAWTMYKSKR